MKRMIDNKEFDTLKSDVNELKQEAIEIPKAKDKGMYFALEEPTENTGVYTYSKLTIGNLNPDIPLKVGDLIMSFDTTDVENVKSANMWKIDEVDSDSIEVVLVGKVGGSGKQLYSHKITAYSGQHYYFSTLVITDKATPFTWESFTAWLQNNSYNGWSNGYTISGIAQGSYVLVSIYASGGGYNYLYGSIVGQNITYESIDIRNYTPSTFEDKVLAL